MKINTELILLNSNQLFEKLNRKLNLPFHQVTEPDEEEEVSSRPLATSPRYQTIERSRPPRPSVSNEDEDQTEGERFRPKYSTIQRSRPTTVEAVVENTTPRLAHNDERSGFWGKTFSN